MTLLERGRGALSARPVALVSARGGMDVEDVAARERRRSYGPESTSRSAHDRSWHAGLGMGTMDAVRSAGGAAANFSTSAAARDVRVARSYRLVTDDARVRAVFVDIFGGITRGDQVARGIVAAAGAAGVRHVPLVVRLTGTNAREGRAILGAAGIEPVDTMDEGARRAVALAEAARGDLSR